MPRYSITSSARASNDVGSVMPSALGGRQVDEQIELSWLLDGGISRLRPAQNLVDKIGGAPIGSNEYFDRGAESDVGR